MKIRRETTVICANTKNKSIRTNIPAIFRDVMELRPGDKLQWDMRNPDEIIIRKKQLKD